MSDPYIDNVSLLLHFDGTGTASFLDSGPVGLPPTTHGGAQTTATSPIFGARSGLFSYTTSDWVEYPTDAGLELGGGLWTIEAWVTCIPGLDNLVLFYGDPTSPFGSSMSYYFEASPYGVKFTYNTDFGLNIVSGTELPDSDPHHVAVVCSGSSIDLYIDGVSVGGGIIYDPIKASSTGWKLCIGMGIYGGSPIYANGKMDELRITKGVARYAYPGFTVPDAPFEGAPQASASINVTLPSLQVAVRTGGRVEAVLPMLTFDAAVVRGVANTIAVRLPALTAQIRTAQHFPIMLPPLQASLAVTSAVLVKVGATLPMLQVSLLASTGSIASVNAVLPALQVSARSGLRASATLGPLAVQMSVTTGSISGLNAVLPALVADLQITSGVGMAIEAALPALAPGPFGRIVAVLPMLRAEMSVQLVVAVTYEAYAVNLQPSAGYREAAVHEVTRYTGFDFDQIIRWQGQNYGVRPDGVYLLGGDLDGAAPIPWAMDTGLSRLGSNQKKTVRQAIAYGRVGKGLTASASIRETTTMTYAGLVQSGEVAEASRIKFGKGLKAVYWGFGLADPKGGPADIDSLQLDAAELSRKVY